MIERAKIKLYLTKCPSCEVVQQTFKKVCECNFCGKKFFARKNLIKIIRGGKDFY